MNPQENNQGRLIKAQADALESKILLEELRAGRITNAVELLEQQLDIQILWIDRFRRTASQVEAEHALSTLRAVEEYRFRYPRTNEANSEGVERLDPVFSQAQERVTAILRDAKTSRNADGSTNVSQSVRPRTNSTSPSAGVAR